MSDKYLLFLIVGRWIKESDNDLTTVWTYKRELRTEEVKGYTEALKKYKEALKRGEIEHAFLVRAEDKAVIATKKFFEYNINEVITC